MVDTEGPRPHARPHPPKHREGWGALSWAGAPAASGRSGREGTGRGGERRRGQAHLLRQFEAAGRELVLAHVARVGACDAVALEPRVAASSPRLQQPDPAVIVAAQRMRQRGARRQLRAAPSAVERRPRRRRRERGRGRRRRWQRRRRWRGRRTWRGLRRRGGRRWRCRRRRRWQWRWWCTRQRRRRRRRWSSW